MRQRLLKPLRIAVTAVSLLVCVLLIVMWVRSYIYWDCLTFKPFHPGFTSFVSHHAAIATNIKELDDSFYKYSPNFNPDDPFEYFDEGWTYTQGDCKEVESPQSSWGLEVTDRFVYVSVPHWFCITIFATIAFLPWLKWRFSLRTLMIVVTLFAVFFGAIAMSM